MFVGRVNPSKTSYSRVIVRQVLDVLAAVRNECFAQFAETVHQNIVLFT